MTNSLPSLLKPTLKTKFRVDFDWWKNQDRNWRASLLSFLCEEHQRIFADVHSEVNFDLVDENTGEVTQGDALLTTLVNHCAKHENFISDNSALVDSIFKIFLVNGNQPFNSEEIAAQINRPAETILRTIGSSKVYKGIRPV
jgi:hypothetical protein